MFWSQFLQEPHNLFLSVPVSSDLQLSELHFCRVGKPMNPALTTCLFCFSHTPTVCGVLCLSDLHFHFPLCCLLGVVPGWLYPNVFLRKLGRSLCSPVFLTCFLVLFPSCVRKRQTVLDPQNLGPVVNSTLQSGILLSAIPWSQKGKHLSWDLIWNYSSRKRFSPFHLKKLTRGMS